MAAKRDSVTNTTVLSQLNAYLQASRKLEAMHLKILVWISLISLVFGVPYFRLPLG